MQTRDGYDSSPFNHSLCMNLSKGFKLHNIRRDTIQLNIAMANSVIVNFQSSLVLVRRSAT